MQEFKNFGKFLTWFRHEHLKERQKTFSKELGVGEKCLRDWEKGHRVPSPRNINEICKKHRLPYELLVLLSGGIPIFFSPRTYRFARSIFEQDFINNSIIEHELFNIRTNDYTKRIMGGEALRFVEMSITTAVPSDFVVEFSVMKHGISEASEINHCGVDQKNYLSGHCVILPLRKKAYCLLRDDETFFPSDLAKKDIVNPEHNEPFGLFLYSCLASSSNMAYHLLRSLTCALLRQLKEGKFSDKTYMGSYVVTADGKDLCSKLNMESKSKLSAYSKSEVRPIFMENSIDKFVIIKNYRAKLHLC